MKTRIRIVGLTVLAAALRFVPAGESRTARTTISSAGTIPAVQKRIDDGIEQNRKSDAVLTIVDAAGKPLAGAEVKIAQKSHEFLFGCNIFVLGQMKEKNAGLRRGLPEAVQLRHGRLLLGRSRTGIGQAAV